MIIRSRIVISLALAAVGAGSASAVVGNVVVCHDEWTLSDVGFGGGSTPDVFAVNVANWFIGGGSGSFRAWSNNFGLTGGDLSTAMTNAGHSWTANHVGTFNLATLQTYDGIFLSGNPGN